MIISHDLMAHLGLLAYLKHQFLQWGGARVPMKEPIGLLWKIDLTSLEMCEVLMQTAEPVSTKDDTESLVKILGSTYQNSDLEQVDANATQLNSEQRTQLLRLLKYFG